MLCDQKARIRKSEEIGIVVVLHFSNPGPQKLASARTPFILASKEALGKG